MTSEDLPKVLRQCGRPSSDCVFGRTRRNHAADRRPHILLSRLREDLSATRDCLQILEQIEAKPCTRLPPFTASTCRSNDCLGAGHHVRTATRIRNLVGQQHILGVRRRGCRPSYCRIGAEQASGRTCRAETPTPGSIGRIPTHKKYIAESGLAVRWSNAAPCKLVTADPRPDLLHPR